MRSVKGLVDSAGRALVTIRLQHPISKAESALDAWIDTGFTGDLVLPQAQVATLGFPLGPVIGAVLADGRTVQLDTYSCLLEWFGQWKSIEVVANQGQFPLLGVALLKNHELHIDYRLKTVQLT
jgi:clan AA aspartic protease